MNIENPKKKYVTTETCVYSCQYHVIWTTKYRKKLLKDDIADDLKQLILSKQEQWNYNIIDMEIMPDHVHLLIEHNPTDKAGINLVITRIKGYTAHELRAKYKELTTKVPTLWTRSRFISTVGSVSLETVKNYIANQKKRGEK